MAHALKELGRGLNRAWDNVADGWRQLLNRSSSALTRFIPGKTSTREGESRSLETFPHWGLMAGEVIETDNLITVKVEMPGVSRDDCDIRIADGSLYICGEKHVEREHADGSYHLMERAYGSFERVIPLPPNVHPDSAKASYRDGVLKVEISKKRESSTRRRIKVA